MTKSRQRWFALIRGCAALCCTALLGVAASSGLASAGLTSEAGVPTVQGFNFDNGNAPIQVVLPKVNIAVRATVSSDASDATIVLRIATLLSTAWFDAIAPYHPTAVGIYSRLGRRPASERTTEYNRNVAILYSSYRVLNSLMPDHASDWRDMMTSVGLDPNDDKENNQTAAGIGNRAGNSVVAHRVHDGMNQLGDAGGRRFNRQPYADYLGYQSVNTATELRDPSRWQPRMLTKGNGLFQVQQFATPQMRVTEPYSYQDPNEFLAPAPRNSDYRNAVAYKRQADEVLAASAALNDERKMKAEYFNDKFGSLGVSAVVTAQQFGLNLERFVQYHFVVDVAVFDTAIAVWNNKYIFDAVRPFSAIHYLYGNQPVTAWGGPGMGTVSDIPGNEWRSYLNTADHPEYPSGSAGFCAAHAQAARRYIGTDRIDFTFRFPPGSSRIEPGVTPATELALTWPTWTDFARDCGLSRLWGGVHFMPAINASWVIGDQIGSLAYEYVQRHIDGTAGPIH